ncbi:LysE family translocator [Ferrovibrio sp.]|uniref:LysE family translocator n=1 Tax=Ferrovibrio sp. TaxID=1917215 RepID=UPI00260E49D0|nr:LysE family translocator [Ferrovibrio sp.]
MTAGHALAFFVFSLVAAITPGPSNVLLAAVGAQGGLRRGLACLFGVSAGMGSMMFLAAAGLGSILLTQPQLLFAGRICGSAFLLWLAWRIATAAPADEKAAKASPPRPVGFLGAAALQWVNPKAWLVSTSAVATYLPAGENTLLQSVGFASVFVLAALPSGLVWLLLGSATQHLLHNRRRQRVFGILMGLALAGSVAMILR